MAADPIGEAIRNLFALQRLGNGLSRDSGNLIRALFNDIVSQLARIDPTAPRAAAQQRARIQKLLGEVGEMSRERFDDLHRLIRDGLAHIGTAQGEFAISMLRATLGGAAVDIAPGRIGINLVKSIVDTNPIQGELLRDWFRDASRKTTIMVRRQIQLGMAQNETIDDMVRRIRGRSVGGGRYSGGVMATTTREAEAIVRTAVNEIANVAHLRTYQENDDVVSEVELVATLDTRTTLLCASLDGTRWPVNSPDIRRPPLHIRCRSSLVPRINWAALGLEEPADSTRASMDGQVSSSMRYEGWLRGQPAAIQNQILGPTRAELFRQGRVTLEQLVRTDGRVIPISQLPRAAAPPAPAPRPARPPAPTPPPREIVPDAPRRGSFSSDEWDAVTQYTSGAYKRINPALREGMPLDAPDQGVVDGLDSAISGLSSDHELLYRGEALRGNVVRGRGSELAMASTAEERTELLRRWALEHAEEMYQVGAVIEDAAFVSTSKGLAPALDASAAAGGFIREPIEGLVFRIRNARGLDLSNVAEALQFDDEAEVILGRGTRFRILSVRRDVLEYDSGPGMGATRNRIVVDVEVTDAPVGVPAPPAAPPPTVPPVPDIPAYVPKATTRAVQDYVRDELGLFTEARFSGMDVGVANEIARALHEAKHRWGLGPMHGISATTASGYKGQFRIQWKAAKTLDDRVYTQSLQFSKNAFPSVEEGLRRIAEINGQARYLNPASGRAVRWGATVDGAYGTAIHEIGHALHFQKARDFFLGFRAQAAFKELDRLYDIGTWHTSPAHMAARAMISEYSFTNNSEYVAESFVAWTKGWPIHPDMKRFIEEVLIR